MNLERLKEHLHTNWKGELTKALVALGMAFFLAGIVLLGVFFTPKAHADDKTVIHIGELSTSNVIEIATEIERAEKGTHIILIFNTFGGEVNPSMDLVKIIELSVVPVVCIVDVKAMSAGLFLLQACDVRLATDRSVFMGHEPYMTFPPSTILTTAKLKSTYDSLVVLSDSMAAQITSKSIMTKAEYKEKIVLGNWYFTPSEALTNGFIDGIIPITEYINYIR